MKIKPSTATSLTNKKTAPPTVGKISKPKSFKGKSKTRSKLTSTPNTPKTGKKKLSPLQSSGKKNKKISPELNLGLKIEKILENGGPNVVRLNSESETPNSSLTKKKKKVKNEGTEVQNLKKTEKRTKREDTDASEQSDKRKSTRKLKKKTNSPDKTGDHEIHSQQEGKEKVKLNRNQLAQSKNTLETEPSSSDAVCQSNEETDEKVMYLNSKCNGTRK